MELINTIWYYVSFIGCLAAIWYGIRTKMKPSKMSQEKWDFISVALTIAVIVGLIHKAP